MNIRTMICLLMGLFCWLFSSGAAHATMGGTMSVGPVGTGSGSGGYFREWVQLQRQGDLLVGVPYGGPLRLIVIHAPQAMGGHVVLRWSETNNGMTSFLISAPDELNRIATRASVYLRSTKTARVLYENQGSTRVRHDPQFITVSVPSPSGNLNESVIAFSVKGLGSYWIVKPKLSSNGSGADAATLPAENPIFDGNIFRAGANWALAFLLLALSYNFSRYVHRNYQRAGD